jgi:tripartite-type tricarboxylate transporter receptor subunit TctC
MKPGTVLHVFAAVGLAASVYASIDARPTWAQSDNTSGFPSRPLRLIVPMSAGGGNDLFARLVGQSLSEILKQPVLIENKPGANGIIGAEYVANSKPDGYTLLVGPSGPIVCNPAVYAKLPYDPPRDFTPLTQIAEFPLVLVVSAKAPIHSVQELVTYAKAHPSEANYSAPAMSYQLINELFKLRTGTPMVMVAYKGGGDSLMGLLRGDVLYNINDAAILLPYIESGQVRALAVGGARRLPQLPDVPTLEEAGVTGATFRIWSGLFAPKATPPAILARLTTAAIEAVKSPEVSGKLRTLLVEPSGISPDEFAKVIDEDLRSASEVARAANIRLP